MKFTLKQPEFPRPLPVEKIPAHGMEQVLDANESERRALAERFGLVELKKLHADLTVHPERANQAVSVTGKITADFLQQCVVSLEPLPGHIEHEIDVLFMMPSEDADFGADLDDETETIQDDTIDLGELVSQNLGVMIDPYPRKPGLAYVEAAYGDKEPAKGPLAQLANWPKKPKK